MEVYSRLKDVEYGNKGEVVYKGLEQKIRTSNYNEIYRYYSQIYRNEKAIVFGINEWRQILESGAKLIEHCRAPQILLGDISVEDAQKYGKEKWITNRYGTHLRFVVPLKYWTERTPLTYSVYES